MAKEICNVDVLEWKAEGLIYSTNLFLNCSGGVGSCLATKYGPQLQESLHSYLAKANRRHADQGEIIELVTDLMPYKNVFHTLPCDGFYNTNSEIVVSILSQCLDRCLDQKIRTVAMSALATGYGHFDRPQFFRCAAKVFSDSRFAELDISICLDHRFGFDEASEQIVSENLPLGIRL